MTRMFAHLRIHTEFSVVDGTNRIDEIVKTAASDQQGALAITDLCNLFGTVKFYKECRKQGVKPLIGADVWVEVPGKDASAPSARLLLLVQNHQGYLNLSELLTRAWTKNAIQNQAVIKLAWLQPDGDNLGVGLIALSGAQGGAVGQALLQGDTTRATHSALHFAGLFPHRFYLEVQRAERADDERHVIAAVQLAVNLKLPVVATHPVQFLTYDDYEAHEARVCISEGEILGNARRVRKFTRQQYFKSSAEMAALFADLPVALANAGEIAKRCNLTLELGKPMLPEYPTPEVNGVRMTPDDYFRHASFEGLQERLAHLYPNEAVRDAKRPEWKIWRHG